MRYPSAGRTKIRASALLSQLSNKGSHQTSLVARMQKARSMTVKTSVG